jgi:hypothetical protein
VAATFAGTARRVGADGTQLSKGEPRESYDFTFVVELVKHRIRDYDVLALALKLRPDRHAADRGDKYVAEIIARALNTAGPEQTPEDGHEFIVEDVIVYHGDDTRFTLTIKVGDRSVPVTFDGSNDLFRPHVFRTRCFDKLLVNVRVQRGNAWRNLVEGWMESAHVLTPPSEITRAGAIKRAVKRALGRVPLGESFEDLREGRGLIAEQRGKKVLLFDLDAVLLSLRSHDLGPTRDELYTALTDLGAKRSRHTVVLDGSAERKKTSPCWLIAAPKELVDVSFNSPPPPSPPTPTGLPDGLL